MSPNRWTIPLNKQIVGNVGLFYACYWLSRLGWNVMPTSRNARGIDILIYSQDATRKYTIQVKTLSGLTPVPLGTSLDGLSPCLIPNDILHCSIFWDSPVSSRPTC